MSLTGLLRAVSVAIAVAGLVDPVLVLERQEMPPLTIAVLDSPSPGAERWASAEALAGHLDDVFDVHVEAVASASRRAACSPDAACVLVVSDGARAPRLMSEGSTLVGVVRERAIQAPGVTITSVDARPKQHPQASGRLRVTVEARAPRGSSQIEVFDVEALVGSATVDWSAAQDVEGVSRQVVDVDFWPVAEGLRRLTVRISPVEGEAVQTDNVADVTIDVVSHAVAVLVYEGRPSWATTFVRRALEVDPRFRLRAVSRLAPDLVVSAGPRFHLEPEVLDQARAVIVGAPEELTGPEVTLLDGYVRKRGGSLVLVPDRPLSGEVMRIVPARARERLERERIPVGALSASELLVFPSLPPAARPLASTGDGAAVIISAPSGAGRFIVSGALDAWRDRETGGPGFDGFWQSLVADAALAAGEAFDLQVAPRTARPGDEIRVALVHRTMSPDTRPVAMAADVACDGLAPTPVRLWPDGRGRFEGTVVAASEGRCRVRARMTEPGSHQAESWLLVSSDVALPPDRSRSGAPERLARAFGAPVVDSGEEGALARHVRERVERRPQSIPGYPMRSPFWILPFAGCLGAEWWIRRRSGRR